MVSIDRNRERWLKVRDLVTAYRGISVEELAELLECHPDNIVPKSGNPKWLRAVRMAGARVEHRSRHARCVAAGRSHRPA